MKKHLTVFLMVLMVVFAAWLAQAIYAASSTDELGGETGKYTASQDSPDSLTTTKSGATLIVTDGSASPDNSADAGKVQLTGKSGATATFSGRTTGWGCTYTVHGVYAGTGPGTATWTNIFEERVEPRIILEVNNSGTTDDKVGLDVGWTSLVVKLEDGQNGVTYTVNNFTDSGTGAVSFSASSVSLTTSNDEQELLLTGDTEGAIEISATCTQAQAVVKAKGTVVLPIKTPNGDPTTTAGANSTNEITFSTATPGIAAISCEANLVVKNSLNFLWEISDADNIVASWNPGWHLIGEPCYGVGIQTTATYTGLPVDNSGFGSQFIILTAPNIDSGSGWAIQDIELFFPKAATNHPYPQGEQPNTPNWFYYWKQTSAYFGTMTYNANVTWAQCILLPPNYVCQLGVQAADTRGTAPVGKNAQQILSGIDLFAYECRHEWKHHLNMLSWWGTGGRVAANDGDGDFIPDNLEAGISVADGGPFDNTEYDTFIDDGIVISDHERYTVFTQNEWGVGDADDEDWSSGGKMYHSNNN